MKMVKRLGVYCLCVALLLSLQVSDMVLAVLAESAESEEQKSYSNATADDAFADDSILVVLNNEASLKNLETGKATFSELAMAGIEDLTCSRSAQIKDMVDERNNATLVEKMLTSDHNAVEIAEYHQVLCVTLKERGKENVLKAIKLLEQREDVLYVCPNYIFTVDYNPASSSSEGNYPAPEAIIGLADAQAMAANSDPVYIGVLDTGIDASHSDLEEKVDPKLSKNFVAHTTIDEDEKIIQEANIDPCTDPDGHGTHVAGIIVKTANNVRLVSLRVLDSNRDGLSSDLIKAIDYVVVDLPKNEANPPVIPILNFSGGYKISDINEINKLYDKIPAYNGLFVCGAGNTADYVKEYGNAADNPSGNKTPIYLFPASFDFGNDDRMIVVGASNQADNGLWIGTIDPGSNYGKCAIDLFAPGESIYSCWPGDSRRSMSGTSMATPYVTGVAALILSIAPNMEAISLKSIITNPENVDIRYNSEGINELLCVSGGRLNAYKVMSAVHEMGYHTFGQWSALSVDQHYRVCAGCGDEEIKSHMFNKEFVNSCVFFTCAECGYYKEQHAQSPVHTAVDALTHQMTYPCCNTTSTETHTWTAWVDLDTTYHCRTCTDCGYEQLQTHRECWNSLKEMCIACKRTGPITDVVQLQPPAEEEETQ